MIRVPYVAIAAVLVGVIAMPATPWLPDPLIVIVIFPVLLFLAVQAPAPSGIFLKSALWAGAISYPLYAIHVSLLKAAYLVAPNASTGVRAGYWILTLILIVCFSWATEVFYDAPIRRWLRKTAPSSRSRRSKAQRDSSNETEASC
jgi:peptidoglycan/LPS O-acetylase OafA/YrhL